ncbi:MAG: hypothetical protein ACXWNK_02550 [Vulcanimicrobiaceae bacterium]
MASFRTLGIVLMLAALLGGAANGRAVADPPPWAHTHHGHEHDAAQPTPSYFEGGPAQDAGVITGVVQGVDYGSGSLLLDTPRGRIVVQVTPSTSIFRGRSGYAALTDLGRGARVQVFVSNIAGRLIAQIIRIR